jgi:hypothetical protein
VRKRGTKTGTAFAELTALRQKIESVAVIRLDLEATGLETTSTRPKFAPPLEKCERSVQIPVALCRISGQKAGLGDPAPCHRIDRLCVVTKL